MKDTVEFTEEAVKEYLDERILVWRKARVTAQSVVDWEDVPVFRRQYELAMHYIEAFQDVRMSLFGEFLPNE